MKKIRIYSIISLVGTIVFSSVLFMGNNLGIKKAFTGLASECTSHEGYHYADTAPTAINPGHTEFYSCCKCHKYFLTKENLVGNFTDKKSDSSTFAQINPSDERYKAPLGFKNKFPDTTNYLCKVGNINSIDFNLLYDYSDEIADFEIEQITSANISKHSPIVRTAKVALRSVTKTVSDNKIQFNDTGVIKLTPKDINNNSHPEASMYLEVVNAKNITSLGSVDGTETSNCSTDYTLLSNSPMWNSLTFINGGHTLYGNGFTFSDSSRGTYLKSGGMARGFISVTNGATLENLIVKNRVYPKAFIYNSEGSEYVTQSSNLDTVATEGDRVRYMYQLSSVLLGSNGTINNCYIYGGRNNVLIAGGDVTISNSVLDCGTLANIQVNSASGSTITLDNITTIQRLNSVTIDSEIKLSGDTDPAKVYGAGIMVGKGESGETNPSIKIRNLKQYNWVCSDEASQITSSSTAKTLFNSAIKTDGITKSYNDKTYANTGLIILNSAAINFDNDNSSKYQTSSLSFGNKTGSIYTLKAEESNVEFIDNQKDAIGIYSSSSKDNEYIRPTITYVGNVTGSSVTSTFNVGNNVWEYKLELNKEDSFDDYTFNKSDISVLVRGKTYDFTFKNANGDVINSVVLSETGTTSYTINFDVSNYVGSNGKAIENTISYSLPLDIIFTKGSKPTLTKASDPSGTAVWVGTGTDAWNIACDALDGLKIEYYSQSSKEYYTGYLKDKISVGTGKLNGTNSSYSYSGDDFNLTITSTGFKTNDAGMPVGAGGILYFTIQTTSGFCSASTTSRSATLTYTFTDKFNNTLTFSKSFSKSTPTNKTDIYKYSSFTSGTLEKLTNSSSCFTSNTLITLPNGEKKEIKNIKNGDFILTYNFFTGKQEPSKVISITNHGFEAVDKITLTFENSLELNILGVHDLFDTSLDKFVSINSSNVNTFIGHTFSINECGMVNETKLISATTENVFEETYSVLSANNVNAYANDILSLTPRGEFLLPFEIDNMKFDEACVQADIEKYGLMSYDEFCVHFDKVPEEVYCALNAKYMKIAIGKGIVTLDEVVEYAAVLLNDTVL